MTGDVFYWLLNMSLSASLTGAVIALLRCIKKLPRRGIMVLWSIPILRMLIPFGVGSKYGLMTLLSRLGVSTVVKYSEFEVLPVTLTASNYMMMAKSYFPIIYKVDLFHDVFRVASVVWVIVAAVLMLTGAILYILTFCELRGAVHWRDNIYLSEKVTSPAVYGVVRQRIVLPVSYRDKDIKYVIMHETVHVRRHDNLWRMVALAISAVYWFNPLTWVFLKLFLTDMELSCDEHVLVCCGEAEKKEYARALLDCAERRNLSVSQFGGAAIGARIKRIISYKKMSVLAAAAMGLLLAAITYILITNAV